MSVWSVLGGVGKAVAGVATGNLGMAAGGLGDIFGKGGGSAPQALPGGAQLPALPQLPGLPTTSSSWDVTLGGVPLIGGSRTTTGGAAPQVPAGALGVGVAPTTKNVTVHKCPKGYRLAINGQCFPKSMVPRGLRKWKPEPRPIVSRSDQKAIHKADRARHRLVRITKDAGAYASMHAPRRDKPARRRK